MKDTVDELGGWPEANQRYLIDALARVAAALDQHTAGAAAKTVAYPEPPPTLSPPSAVERLCLTFGLSAFERDIVLLCAGIELDSTFASRCGSAQGDPQRNFPTFSLALAALPEAHWSALIPSAPLRHWRLIEVGPGATLTQSPLRIDERVLHYLAGVQQLDELLAGVVEDVDVQPDHLAASQIAIAERVAALWRANADGGAVPVIQLCGGDGISKRAVAAAACADVGVRARLMTARSVPVNSAELETLIRMWQREVALAGGALLLDCDDLDETDVARMGALRHFIDRLGCALIVITRDRRPDTDRASLTFEVERPTSAEQGLIWQRHLGTAGVKGAVDALISQFDLSAPVIHAAAVAATARPDAEREMERTGHGLPTILWDACRAQSRPRLEALARRIVPSATWDDIVLPAQQILTLRELAVHVRQRGTVYERWEFAKKYGRGLGISALFAGPSGTGKTMAAEVLANELRLDLYHIDLSQVVSKYIGETEKNLRRLFDAAEGGGALLLFDEADALFGKRSEVKDSHDRYANIEVSYLLQRMEAYRGLAILTTNMKESLDAAFLRRIRFVVQFPFPDLADRAEIWRRVFPKATPTNGLVVEKLARLNLSGGTIRNIAMNAAFLAAEDGGAIQMKHLAGATRREFIKLEKPLSDAEVGTWT